MVIGIIVGVLASALVVFTVAFNVVRRKKGKCSCGNSCDHCNACRVIKKNGEE